MTDVKHPFGRKGTPAKAAASGRGRGTKAAAVPAPRELQEPHKDELESTAATPVGVRLQPDEIAELREVMAARGLATQSAALREGLRLLVRETRSEAAAAEIWEFYGEQEAPLPEGVVPVTADELAAADAEIAQWQ